MSHVRCHKNFTELLRTLSQDENLVELRRQDLSMHYDFEPQKAFALIDVDNDGSINAEEVQTFLLKHNIDVDPKEIKNVIYDYDSNNDGELGLPEFCQLTLPSTNPVLRSVAE
jgi:Ca2+-binding EF-hand superfamily protein